MKHFLMIKAILFGIALFTSYFGLGQGNHFTEEFTDLPNSYTSGDYSLPSGQWNLTAVVGESASASYNGTGKAARINDDISMAQLTTPSVNGIGSISFYYRELNSGGGTFLVQKSVDGGSWETIGSQSFSGQTYTFYSLSINDPSNNIRIRVLSDDNPGHLIIDVLTLSVLPSGNTPPSITNIVLDPAADITSSNTVSVSADVTDSDGTVSSVVLNWGTSSGSLSNTITMSNSGSTYTTNTAIPAQADGTTVYFTITATDDDSDATTTSEQSYEVSDPVVSLINIAVGTTVEENFDGIGTTATASLPTGWKVDKNTTVRSVGTFSGATTNTERIGGNTSFSTNGIYNFGAGAEASATDRAIGGLSSANDSKSVNTYVQLYNNGISEIAFLSISYDVEKYRNGTNSAGFSIQMYYSTDGTNWTSAGSDFLTSFGADANSNHFDPTPGQTVSISSKILNQVIPQNQSIYLAWNYSVTSGTTTSNAQALGIDNVTIAALSEEAIVPPTNFVATPISTTTIDLSWDQNAASNNVMIVRNTSDVFGTPADGVSYTTGNSILGGGTVVVVSSGTTHSDNTLDAATEYFYKAFSVTVGNNYSDGTATVNATTYSPEPSNHATGLAATTNSSTSITLTWTDASTGAQLPQSYLVKANAGSDPSAPVDGTPEADSDFIKNVVQGTETVVFTNLTAETEYHFAIWPYTNSGSIIDYKTSPAAPSATATTEAAPSGGQYVVDFEGTGETKTGYASGTVTLSGLDWDMTEALIGTSASDFKNGARAARMRGYGTSSMTMLADKTDGLGTISFQYRRYSTEAQVDWKVEYSTNGGTDWTQVGNVFTAPASSDVQTFSETVNVSGNVRIRIKRHTGTGTSDNRLNIDDITLTDYSSGTTTDPEPSNHVTGFDADVFNHTQINISWVDATGTQLPAGYLVKAASGSSPVAPIDGVTETPGDLIKYINYDVESVLFENLSPETEYTFAIWPYTNAGATIDYKTDGTVPEITETTNPAPPAPVVWINEFHYDNTGSQDENEFVEIVLKNAGLYTLSDFSILLYNGNGGAAYDTKTLDLFTEGSTIGDFTIYSYTYPNDGIQNGPPDGIAIAYQGTLISGQFLSYEGTFTAVGGPADGVTSVDVGVSQTNSTAVNSSLQLTGVGIEYADFYWISTEGSNTKGAINADQSFEAAPATTTFTGNAPGNGNAWFAPVNWSNGVPGKNSNVTIPAGLSNFPNINHPKRVQTILLESGATIVGAEKLTVNGNATMRRNISQYTNTSSADGWNLIASPMAAAGIGGSDFLAGNYDLYRYDEVSNTWLNQKQGANSALFQNFEQGVGYLYATSATATRNFIDNAFTASNVTISSLTKTAEGGGGWHLLGNPFPANLIFGTGWTLTNVGNTAQVLKSDGTGYKSIAVGEAIAANQGFFVQVSEGTGSVTIPASAASHSEASFSAKSNQGNLRVYLHIDENRKVETRLMLIPESTDGFDWSYDANYLPPFSASIPRLYTQIDTQTPLALNAFPLNDDKSIPLVIDVSVEAGYLLEVIGLETLSPSVRLYLKDRLTREVHNINENSSLYLSVSPDDYDNRFELFFTTSALSDESTESAAGLSAYSSGEILVVNNAGSESLAISIEIYSTAGQLLYQARESFAGEKHIELNLPGGIYILKAIKGNHNLNQKFFIR